MLDQFAANGSHRTLSTMGVILRTGCSYLTGSLYPLGDDSRGGALATAGAGPGKNSVPLDDSRKEIEQELTFDRSEHSQNFLLARVEAWPSADEGFLTGGGQRKKMCAPVLRIDLAVD